jgi:hypothetical protein
MVLTLVFILILSFWVSKWLRKAIQKVMGRRNPGGANAEKVAADVHSRWGVAARPPLVVLTGFGDNSVNWEIGVWMNDPWNSRMASSDLHLSLWWAFKDEDLTIAFPQLDVHFDPPVVNSLLKVAGRAA